MKKSTSRGKKVGNAPMVPEVLQEGACKVGDSKRVLIIGANSCTGTACLRRFSSHISRVEVHAFCRDSSKLRKEDKAFCDSVIEGNAADATDIKMALRQSNANVVLVCIESGNCIQKKRTASAQALVQVLKKKKFKHVRALVVSRVGAGGSQLPIGMGIGTLMRCRSHFVLKDHAGQEKAFSLLKERVTIVRPTAVKDMKPTGRVQEFGNKDRLPSFRTPRDDLATWITGELCSGVPIGGRIANITGMQQ